MNHNSREKLFSWFRHSSAIARLLSGQKVSIFGWECKCLPSKVISFLLLLLFFLRIPLRIETRAQLVEFSACLVTPATESRIRSGFLAGSSKPDLAQYKISPSRSGNSILPQISRGWYVMMSFDDFSLSWPAIFVMPKQLGADRPTDRTSGRDA